MKKAEKRANKLLEVEKKSFGEENLSFAASEAYKLLRANLLFALPDEGKNRVVGVTSSSSGEGKSTTVLNLSYMLAKAGKKVLLIEADMRLPSVTRRLGLSQAPGLSNLLAGMSGTKDVIQESGLHEKLKILSAGELPPNPSELLGSKRMKTLMEVLSTAYDFVFLDLPPVTEVSDAVVASQLTDGIIMVARQNYTDRRLLDESMRQLKFVKAKVLGFVMTHSDAVNRKQKYSKKSYNNGSYNYEKAETGDEAHG